MPLRPIGELTPMRVTVRLNVTIGIQTAFRRMRFGSFRPLSPVVCGIFGWLMLASTVTAQTSQRPVILFTDIASGPATGNSDNSQPGQSANQDGAIVTVWGKYLGTTPGTVTVNGIPARIYSRGNANSPANLYVHHGMQMVSFQIPHTAAAGLAAIQAMVGALASNTLPFTIQPGNIYFVAQSGDDSAGDGSWGKPWATLPNAVLKLSGGDILYACDGVSQTQEQGDDATFDLESYTFTGAQWASQGSPKGLVAYPGANVGIGSNSVLHAYSLFGGGNYYSQYWTIAKLSLTAQAEAAFYNAGFRIVGNYITAPSGDGETGALAGGDSTNLEILGNELTNIGAKGCSKLYHAMYVQSAEADSGPRLPDEPNREIAWNYIHDNYAYVGINIYREGASSAFMLNTSVHDNYIMSQSGSGILLGTYLVGPDNYVYNNVIIDAGKGPASNDVEDPVYELECVDFEAGWRAYLGKTIIHFFNNTLYNCGDTVAGITGGMLLFSGYEPFALDFRNNIVQSTGFPYISPNSGPFPSNSGSNNIWYGQVTPPSFDGAPIARDPLLWTPASPTGNAHLQLESPAIGSGSTTAPIPVVDFDNLIRPNPPSIGAFEYAAAAGAAGPSIPTGLTATVASAAQVDLSWIGSTDSNYSAGQIGYIVYRDGIEAGTTTAGVTSYTDSAVAPPASYSYTVAAFDPAGNRSGQSSPSVVSIKPSTQAPLAGLQLLINQALGIDLAVNDQNLDGLLNVVDIQTVLGLVSGQ